MADQNKAVRENVEGEFFVDSTCIDCDTCRQLAPSVFADAGKYSFVQVQPSSSSEEREALRALLSCPTGSIGTRSKCSSEAALADFPLRVDENVFYCGFNSRKSYGGNSYFIEDASGNWLMDSPRYSRHLIEQFEARGGLKYVFLSHQDDVADADRYALHFGAQRIIHRRDLSAMPDCEIIVESYDEAHFDDVLIIPTPGHTAGHMVALYNNRYLFTGDHLYLSRITGQPGAHRDYCWYSWTEQTASMKRLLDYDFEWILPGHGDRGYLPWPRMKKEMIELVDQMSNSTYGKVATP